MSKKIKEPKVKKIKDSKKITKTLLIVLLVLLILDVILIPFLILAEVKRVLPIVFFIVLPTISLGIILLLSRSCGLSYEKKKAIIMEKINEH